MLLNAELNDVDLITIRGDKSSSEISSDENRYCNSSSDGIRGATNSARS